MFKDKLLRNQDLKYKNFIYKLTPNINYDQIIGVRNGVLRKILKETNGSYEAFLNDLPHQYYEENLIHVYIINQMKSDPKDTFKYIDDFLPYVDSWPISDAFKLHKESYDEKILLDNVNNWFKSNKTYYIRTGLILLMQFFEDDFDEKILSLVYSINNDDYYVKMAIAWYYCDLFVKHFDNMYEYFMKNNINEWILRKTISKCNDSLRISEENKKILKQLKYDKINMEVKK